MPNRTVKVDLHVHSHFSDSPKIYLLEKADSRECYTKPIEVYDRARARGMDLVTITDHDTILGCLEIAHLGPHVFLSEEISARFPDNGCVVHILAFDINEAQHDEVQRLRYNIYDLVEYLREEKICHSMAHPLSSVNQRLTREHVEQCLLMFENFELLNGPRDPYHEKALRSIFGALTREKLEQLANKYDIEPVTWSVERGFTGGSDDHSGIAIARAYTEYDGPCTVPGLKTAIAQRRTRTRGEYMTPVSAAHNIYSGVIQYFVDRSKTRTTDGIYSDLFAVVQGGGVQLPPTLMTPEGLSSPLGRVLMAFLELQGNGEVQVPDWDRVLRDGAKEDLHVEINETAMKVMRKVFTGIAEEIVEATSSLDLDTLAKSVPAILQLLLLEGPYYFGFRYFYQDRRRCELLHEALDLGYEPKEAPAVAIFVDTLDDVNGVTLGLRRMIKELRGQGKRVYLVGLQTDAVGADARSIDLWADAHEVEAVIRFAPLAAFMAPGYDQMPLGIPPVLEMVKWAVENQIDLVQASTPGPVGMAALTISKLLGTPIVGHYHTQVPEYVQRLIGDKSITAIVRAFVSWFYGSLDRVIVPSRATADNLIQMGIRPEKLQVLPRGVDIDRFSPNHRNRHAWERYGLNGATKLLYVGRVSKEKSLDCLMEAYQKLRDDGIKVELAIVGDGPYRSQLAEKTNGTPGVTFTGYVGGSDLSELFASADVFVFPSTTDTFGNVVLEAQASSLPVVVTDQGGPSELVIHNRTGMIVPGEDPEALCRAVARLATDDALRGRMASAARDHAEQMTHDYAASELWNFYAGQIETHRQVCASLVEAGI
jgi:glycosyltransferase involved in cell wall biosynthesis